MAKHTSLSPSDCSSRLPISAPALCPLAQTQTLNAVLDSVFKHTPSDPAASPKSLKSSQLLLVCYPLSRQDLSLLAGLPASISALCICPSPSPPYSGFSQQRNHSPAPSHLQSPTSLDFSAPQLPWPSLWVHTAHSGPPPGTLFPKAASSEGPSRTPDPMCALHPSQPPPSAQPPLPNLGSTVVLPPSVSLSVFILLLCWLICFLLMCLLLTQEHLHKVAGLGAKWKRRCPSSNISKTCKQNSKSSVWPVCRLRPPWEPACLCPSRLERAHTESCSSCSSMPD